MSFFVVWDGAIQKAFDTLEEANALVAQHPGARVMGNEWLTLGYAKDRVDRARLAVEEVATMIDPSEVLRMGQALDELEAMLDEALDPIGFGRRLAPMVPTSPAIAG